MYVRIQTTARIHFCAKNFYENRYALSNPNYATNPFFKSANEVTRTGNRSPSASSEMTSPQKKKKAPHLATCCSVKSMQYIAPNIHGQTFQ